MGRGDATKCGRNGRSYRWCLRLLILPERLGSDTTRAPSQLWMRLTFGLFLLTRDSTLGAFAPSRDAAGTSGPEADTDWLFSMAVSSGPWLPRTVENSAASHG